MNIPNRIFKNTLALTISSAGQLVGNIILFFYLSRLLQAEGLGIYSTVIAIFTTVVLGCAVVNPYIPRELPKDLSKTNRYLIHGSLISVVIAITLMIGLDLLVPYLGYLPQTQIGLYIISFALIPEALGVVIYTVFISHQKAKYISASSIFTILGRIVVSILVLRLGFGVISLVVVYTSFSYMSLLINFLFLKRFVRVPQLEFDRIFLWNMLRELKYFAGLTALTALFSQSEVIILSLMSGETQVGFYSAALKLVIVWTMIPKSYVTATFPVLSATFQESRQKAINLHNKSLKYLLAMAFPLAIGIFVIAEVIIPLFYGPGFEESIGVLRILAWYLPLTFCNMVFWRVLIARGEQGKVFRVQFINEIVQVLLAVGLIPIMGPKGAALALLGGNITYASFSIYYILRDKTPLPLVRLSWRFALASVVMGIFAWLCTPRLNLFALIPLAAVIYVVMLWLLRAISSDDIMLFKQIVGFSRKSKGIHQEPSYINHDN